MAKLMELTEVQKLASLHDGAVWLEVAEWVLCPAFMEMAMHNITFFVAVPLYNYREAFNNEDYGAKWRCWREKPTEEERAGVPWGIPAEYR